MLLSAAVRRSRIRTAYLNRLSVSRIREHIFFTERSAMLYVADLPPLKIHPEVVRAIRAVDLDGWQPVDSRADKARLIAEIGYVRGKG